MCCFCAILRWKVAIGQEYLTISYVVNDKRLVHPGAKVGRNLADFHVHGDSSHDVPGITSCNENGPEVMRARSPSPARSASPVPSPSSPPAVLASSPPTRSLQTGLDQWISKGIWCPTSLRLLCVHTVHLMGEILILLA
eukprot:EG_transcript_23534